MYYIARLSLLHKADTIEEARKEAIRLGNQYDGTVILDPVEYLVYEPVFKK